MSPEKNSDISVQEKNFDDFFKTPAVVYPKDFPFVSPLKSDLKRFFSIENPIFKSVNDFTYFTAYKNGHLVGRIFVMVHRASREKFKWKRTQFGYFDCVNDLKVAEALLSQAMEFARKNDSSELVGGFNYSANMSAGIVTKIHKNYHFTDQVFGPEYLADLLLKLNFENFFPVVTHETDIQKIPTDSLLGPKQLQILKDPKFKFEKVRKSKFKEVTEAMQICLNDGFEYNPMSVPLTLEEIHFQAKDLMLIVDEEISSICYYEGRPVGALICIPDLNPLLKNIHSEFGLTTPYYFLKHKLNKDGAIIIFYSVVQDFHSQGINGVMLYEVISALQKRGYKRLGGTWISLDNLPSLRQAEKLGAQVMHELSFFKKSCL